MVDDITAAALEFRGVAAGGKRRPVLGVEAAGQGARGGAASAGADRDAEKQPDRLRDRLLCDRDGFRADLAHLVDGAGGADRNPRRRARSRVAGARRGRDIGRDPHGGLGWPGSGSMTTVEAFTQETATGAESIPLSERGPAPTNVVVGFGFWLFLLSDIVVFASLFAAYAVLSEK